MANEDDVPNGKMVNQYGMSVKDQLYNLEKLFNSELSRLEDAVHHERELREQAFKTIEATIEVEKEAQAVRDEKLNDVRVRFVPREVWEAFEKWVSDKTEQTEKMVDTRMNYFNRLLVGLLVAVILMMAAGILNLIVAGGAK